MSRRTLAQQRRDVMPTLTTYPGLAEPFVARCDEGKPSRRVASVTEGDQVLDPDTEVTCNACLGSKA